MNREDVLKKLVDLGPEPLADALIELGLRYGPAQKCIERLLATSEQHLKHFHAGLANLRRPSRTYFTRAQARDFSHDLSALLTDLLAAAPSPSRGVELVAEFFEHDQYAFERCDDSDGDVGDVFRDDACQLFVRFARDCADKDMVADTMLNLVADDAYGVRDSLFDCATDFLPAETMRTLVAKLWAAARPDSAAVQASSDLRLVEVLARQLKDAPLFEQARRLSWKKLNAAACHDIAEAYLIAGDAATALTWLDRVEDGDTFFLDKRQALALKVHTAIGNQDEQIKVAWRIFRGDRSESALNDLLKIIGTDKRTQVISESVNELGKAAELDVVHASFLANVGELNAAAAHITKFAAKLNGDDYGSLPPLAETFEKSRQPLAASLIYRALLNSILRRARTSSYGHGERYLRKLDGLAVQIADWHAAALHEIYKQEVRQAHGLKHSFWRRYDG